MKYNHQPVEQVVNKQASRQEKPSPKTARRSDIRTFIDDDCLELKVSCGCMMYRFLEDFDCLRFLPCHRFTFSEPFSRSSSLRPLEVWLSFWYSLYLHGTSCFCVLETLPFSLPADIFYSTPTLLTSEVTRSCSCGLSLTIGHILMRFGRMDSRMPRKL